MAWYYNICIVVVVHIGFEMNNTYTNEQLSSVKLFSGKNDYTTVYNFRNTFTMVCHPYSVWNIS